MDENNLKLFKQALSEGVSKKFDKMAAECTEEIVASEKHDLAMRTIIYGKTDTKRVWTPKMKRIIAILVAAALLLTGCGIIFRNEIREVFKDLFVSLTYEGDEGAQQTIEDVYTLSYVPEGYTLENEKITGIYVKYEFINENGNFLSFEQRTLKVSDYYIDSENGYSRIEDIEDYEVYYRFNNKYHLYILNDEKYSMIIKSSTQIPKEEILLIIEGITVK